MSVFVSAQGVSKRFGETTALDDVSIDFTRGTIHAVLGENGSGKSTLVKTLSGIVRLDRGEIRVDGAPAGNLRSPRDFIRAGFSTVFQEVLVAPDRTVAENVLLGMDDMFSWKVRRGDREELVAATLSSLAVTKVNVRSLVRDIPLAQQQLVVIARSIVRNPRLLILDEATAALDHANREKVFSEVELRVSRGMLAIFISHRMDEVFRLSQRVSVLRSGKHVATMNTETTNAEELLRLMAPERAMGGAHG